MLSDKAMEQAMQILPPQPCFHNRFNQYIFEAAVSLYDKGKTADQTMITELLKKKGQFDFVGGRVRMIELINKGIVDLLEHLIVKEDWPVRLEGLLSARASVRTYV